MSAENPVAWAVAYSDKIGNDDGYFTYDARRADSWRAAGATVVPLYRSPTLTDEEREAIEDSEQFWAENSKQASTLRSLLERLA